jgi:hypothetical protein
MIPRIFLLLPMIGQKLFRGLMFLGLDQGFDFKHLRAGYLAL